MCVCVCVCVHVCVWVCLSVFELIQADRKHLSNIVCPPSQDPYNSLIIENSRVALVNWLTGGQYNASVMIYNCLDGCFFSYTEGKLLGR